MSEVQIGTSGASLSDPPCRAPFVAMEFDPFGDVLACCANTLFPLGNVGRSSLREIWEGERAQLLRSAIGRGDLSYGCTVCRHRLRYGHGDLALEYYNNFPLRDRGAWPFSLQFSLHNTCNLACVMCGADRSSRIRTSRSKLPPLPHAYGERFFAEIEPFLANAGAVDFSGGEPFLVAEHVRIWDLLLAMDHRPLCSLTTNGTVWNATTERVLDGLDTHISVSIDGMTAETFEAIRVGARFDTVMANLERFRAYTRSRGTILTISWSLVQTNWHELGAAALFAEELGADLRVQTVIEPEYGVQRLPTAELEQVVRSLEAQALEIEPSLERNLGVWQREVERLRRELANRRSPTRRVEAFVPADPGNVTSVVEAILDGTGRSVDAGALAQVRARATDDLRSWCSTDDVLEIRVDASGAVVDLDADARLPGLRVLAREAGPGLADLLRAYEHEFDGQVWILDEWPESDRLVHTLPIGRTVRDKFVLVLKVVAIAGPDEHRVLLAVDTTLLPQAPSVVGVSFGSSRAPRG